MPEEEKVIKRVDDYENQADRWKDELSASEKMLKDFHKQGDEVVSRYLDEEAEKDASDGTAAQLNLFWSNINTLQSVLFAHLPKVEVTRRYADADDDIARVAGVIMSRLLNSDLEENGQEYSTVLKGVFQDRLLPGLGSARLYYDYESKTEKYEAIKDPENGEEKAPEVEVEEILDEWVDIDYYYWKDVLWSWSRNWKDLRWLAYRTYMTRDEIEERFKDVKVEDLKFKTQDVVGEKEEGDTGNADILEKAEVWEIWDKEEYKVHWWSAGAKDLLESMDDPLELRNFFPCPPFLMANLTTKFYVPKPDYCFAQDLYTEIDTINARIRILTDAVKVVGVYDATSEGVKRMLEEGTENELIPVDNWAMFAEKGGIQGQVDWLPIEAVVNAIVQLREVREENLRLLQEITGMSDIMRGVNTHPREALGTQELKAAFGSVRIQSLQEEFARFATDLLEVKAEIIVKHCEVETIVTLSNAEFLPAADRDKVPAAIAMLKERGVTMLRLNIRSEAMAMVDYTQIKQERTEYINAMALFMQSAAPLVEIDKRMTPTLLEMLKWGLAGFKGSAEIEGVLDKAIEQATKALQQEKPEEDDGEAKKEKAKAQSDLQRIQAKLQADLQIIKAKFMATMQEIQAKAAADSKKEQDQAAYSALEQEFEAAIQQAMATVQANLDIKVDEAAADAKIRSSPKE